MFTKLGRSVSEPGTRGGMAAKKASVWLFAHSSMEQVRIFIAVMCTHNMTKLQGNQGNIEAIYQV